MFHVLWTTFPWYIDMDSHNPILNLPSGMESISVFLSLSVSYTHAHTCTHAHTHTHTHTHTGNCVECGSVVYVVRPLIVLLPAWFRFAQCVRRYRDTKDAFPHLVNAGKYATALPVVFFSAFGSGIRQYYGGEIAIFFDVCSAILCIVSVLVSHGFPDHPTFSFWSLGGKRGLDWREEGPLTGGGRGLDWREERPLTGGGRGLDWREKGPLTGGGRGLDWREEGP